MKSKNGTLNLRNNTDFTERVSAITQSAMSIQTTLIKFILRTIEGQKTFKISTHDLEFFKMIMSI